MVGAIEAEASPPTKRIKLEDDSEEGELDAEELDEVEAITIAEEEATKREVAVKLEVDIKEEELETIEVEEETITMAGAEATTKQAISVEAKAKNPAVAGEAEATTNPTVAGEAEATNPAVAGEAEAMNPAVAGKAEATNPVVAREAEATNPAVAGEAEATKPDVAVEAEATNPAIAVEAEMTKRAIAVEAEMTKRAIAVEAEVTKRAIAVEAEVTKRAQLELKTKKVEFETISFKEAEATKRAIAVEVEMTKRVLQLKNIEIAARQSDQLRSQAAQTMPFMNQSIPASNPPSQSLRSLDAASHSNFLPLAHATRVSNPASQSPWSLEPASHSNFLPLAHVAHARNPASQSHWSHDTASHSNFHPPAHVAPWRLEPYGMYVNTAANTSSAPPQSIPPHRLDGPTGLMVVPPSMVLNNAVPRQFTGQDVGRIPLTAPAIAVCEGVTTNNSSKSSADDIEQKIAKRIPPMNHHGEYKWYYFGEIDANNVQESYPNGTQLSSLLETIFKVNIGCNVRFISSQDDQNDQIVTIPTPDGPVSYMCQTYRCSCARKILLKVQKMVGGPFPQRLHLWVSEDFLELHGAKLIDIDR